ncbi:MAG: hypothetical protein K2G11_05030 [Muribaculaceae bacterium]|nr:hypothetical protein [Muribaculaceae bacterium]
MILLFKEAMIIRKYLGRNISVLRNGREELISGLNILELEINESGEVERFSVRKFEKEEANVEFVDHKMILTINDSGNAKFLIEK